MRQRFTGYQRDAETSLNFAEARYYQNAHGRFTAVDPLLASGKSANPQTFNRYVYAMNQPTRLIDPTGLQSPANPTTSYLTTAHLGSPRVITDATGNVTSRRDFLPFGEELGAGVGPRTEALKYSYSGSDNVRQRFTGYEKDEESGLDFAEARMYQNKHGRFTAVDPRRISVGNTGSHPRRTKIPKMPVRTTRFRSKTERAENASS